MSLYVLSSTTRRVFWRNPTVGFRKNTSEFNFDFFFNVNTSLLDPGIELSVCLKTASLYKYALPLHNVKYGRRPDAQSYCCTGSRLGVLQSQPWKHTKSVLLNFGISIAETTKKHNVQGFSFYRLCLFNIPWLRFAIFSFTNDRVELPKF